MLRSPVAVRPARRLLALRRGPGVFGLRAPRPPAPSSRPPPPTRISTTRSRTPTARSSTSTKRSTSRCWCRSPRPIARCVPDADARLDARLSCSNLQRADHLRQRRAAGQLELAGNTLARLRRQLRPSASAGLFDVADAGRPPLSQQRSRHHARRSGASPTGRISWCRSSGPSNPRDLVGAGRRRLRRSRQHRRRQPSLSVGDVRPRAGSQGIDQRSRNIETLADIERTSLDYYATIRSLYRQRRAARNPPRAEQRCPTSAPIQGGGDGPASPPISYQVARPPRAPNKMIAALPSRPALVCLRPRWCRGARRAASAAAQDPRASSTISAPRRSRCSARACRRRSGWRGSASCSATISTCPGSASSCSAATGGPPRRRSSRSS